MRIVRVFEQFSNCFLVNLIESTGSEIIEIVTISWSFKVVTEELLETVGMISNLTQAWIACDIKEQATWSEL